MATESIETKVKRVVAEICKENPDLDCKRPFNVFVYDPLRQRMHGHGTTSVSLEGAVRILYTMLQKEPDYVGDISIFKPRKRTVYEKK